MPEIKIINKYEDFESIKPAWNILMEEMEYNVSVFSSHAWYEIWWRHYSSGATFNMITMWQAGKLVGIAPLMRRQAVLHGLPVGIVDFIENRNTLHNDFIVQPDARELFLQQVLRVFFERNRECDVLILNNFPILSMNYSVLVKILSEIDRKWQQRPTFDSPYLVLSGTWEDYLASRTPRTRKSLRNIKNNIHKAGEVTVRNIQTLGEYQQVREDIYGIAKQSWTEKIGDSLATLVNRAFFDDLASSAVAKGWLSIWTLQLNEKMIAFEFHLRAFGKEHAMRGSYLQEYASLSPGTYLEMQILKNVFEEAERVKRYDFGGSFDSYKRKWTDDAVPHCAITIFNDRIYSRFMAFHETKIVPLLRRVRDRLHACSIPSQRNTPIQKHDLA